ncbi:MAG: TIGR01440 family protein [Lachnospiraceae bacterium]|nr:TIGR01440 family protein [Lachnospiraceae bacterium]
MSVNGMADKAMEASFLTQVHEEAKAVVYELLEQAKTEEGDILVVGCSSSEVAGEKIGTFSSVETAQAVFEGIYEAAKAKGMFLAAQCCEHLNRALIVEKEVAKRERLTIVNVVPQPKAGGSFATTAYERFENAVAVEHVCAQAGVDIGDTLIGMHLQDVAVPVRIATKKIGNAHVVCARTRAKFVGGSRAFYDEALL